MVGSWDYTNSVLIERYVQFQRNTLKSCKNCCHLKKTSYSAAVESTGQAKAEAQSRAEASRIEGEANVEQSKLKAQASKIEAVC